MDILDRIRQIDGIVDAGSCPFSLLDTSLSDSQRIGVQRIMEHPRTVLCAIFPYYSKPTDGNVSLYARGRDYHAVIQETFAPLCAQLEAEYPGHSFVILTDDSPLPEVLTGCLAGLGVIGKNGLLLHPERGSFHFLGTILTDVDFQAPMREPVFCSNCGACVRACPVQLDKSRCLSGLTQKGGDLTAEEEALVREHPLIWGCDWCQLACPANRNLPTGHPAFTANPIPTLTAEELDGLTRRQFNEKFSGRAFTWKGPRPILRNLQIKEGNPV